MLRSTLIAIALLAAGAPTAGAVVAYQSASDSAYALDGAGGIMIADDTGANRRPLVDGSGYRPQISPDGSRVAWLLANDPYRGAALTMAAVPAPGAELPVPETGLGIRCVEFTWSPDGTRIACVTVGKGRNSDYGPALGLTVVDVATRTATVLVPAVNGQVEGQAWSPDGQRVAFGWKRRSGARYLKARLDVIGADASGRAQLAPQGAWPIWHATFGIAYVREETVICRGDTFADPQASYRMSILDPATGKSRVATNWNEPCAIGPRPFGFLPDGRIAANLFDRAGGRYPVGFQVAIVNPTTQRLTALRWVAGAELQGISADGKRLLVATPFDAQNCALRSVDLAGKNPKTIVRNAIRGSVPVTWAP